MARASRTARLPPPIASGTVARMDRRHLVAGAGFGLALLVMVAIARRPQAPGAASPLGHEDVVDTAAPELALPASPGRAPNVRERVTLPSLEDGGVAIAAILARAPVGGTGFGVETTKSGAPRGPSAPSFTDDGVAILDPVRGEVRRFGRGGHALGALPLPSRNVLDALPLADGKTLLFERSEEGQRLAIADASGKLVAALPLPKAVVNDDADVSRVIVRGGTIYVETNGGGPLHAVATVAGDPLPGTATTDGYPTKDERALLSAGITNEDEGRAWLNASDRGSGTHLWTKELQFADEASAIGFLDDDGHGRGWVVVLLGSRPGAFVDAAICFDVASGRVLASHAVAVDEPAWQSFRDFSVTPTGSLAALRRTKDEARVLELPCAVR